MGKLIYFGVTVSEARAEFLAKMLKVPLCQHCGREASECEADPCAEAQHAHDAHVEPNKQIYQIAVVDTLTYQAHIEAESLEQAKAAVEFLGANDWEPIRHSSQFEEYGGVTDKRKWTVFEVDRTDYINTLAKCGLVIVASHWVDV